jgi:hypothetical protein
MAASYRRAYEVAPRKLEVDVARLDLEDLPLAGKLRTGRTGEHRGQGLGGCKARANRRYAVCANSLCA